MIRSLIHESRRGAASLTAALFLCALGCGKDRGVKSAEDARADVQTLVDLTAKDVGEIERGLPEGAKKLTELLAKDPPKEGDAKHTATVVRSSLLKMRQQVPDLGIAKSTFFVFSDVKGIAIRNDYETDTMGGQDLVAAWPGLKTLVEGAPSAVTTGKFPAPPSPTGPDKEWVSGVAVTKADGSRQGLLVTGWTYRRFAYHLQVTLQREVQDQLLRKGDKGKLPILYVCLFDKDAIYGASAPGAQPVPDVDEKALLAVGLHAKTAAGLASAPLKITDREFGWAADRLPKLAPDVGVVVLRSEL
jgi:hypothetical protein